MAASLSFRALLAEGIDYELELTLRFRPKKRLACDVPEPLAVPERSNEIWSMDFQGQQIEVEPQLP